MADSDKISKFRESVAAALAANQKKKEEHEMQEEKEKKEKAQQRAREQARRAANGRRLQAQIARRLEEIRFRREGIKYLDSDEE